MDDSIGRQAAIDEVARWIGYLDEDMITRIQIGLKRLPSAQPEQRWIPCSEKLPEKSGQYYVSGKGKVWICEFLTIHSSTILLGGWCNDAANPVVQAWMPLPEPYREEVKVE